MGDQPVGESAKLEAMMAEQLQVLNEIKKRIGTIRFWIVFWSIVAILIGVLQILGVRV